MDYFKLKDIGITTQITSNIMRMYGFAMLIPAFIALFLLDIHFAVIFFTVAISSIIIFTTIKKMLKEKECLYRHSIVAIVFSWILVGIISAIPLWFYGMTFIDALFESISGWTGTGLTMIPDPATLPVIINFFRAYIQWVGGFGIVVLVLLIYEKPKTAQNLFLAEGRIEDFYFDMKKIARAIVIIYSAYTVVGIIALKLIGLSWLDAFVHTMTSIATGGYSSNAIGIGVYGNGAILIGIALMYIGSISFLKHHQLLTGKFKAFFFDPEIRFFNIVVLITTIIICFELFLTTKSNYLDGLFYVISAISGTGAGTPFTINMMAPVSIFILILLMIFGATYGSTTGGIKIWRIIILFKVIAREIIKPFYPKGTILNIKIGDKIIPDEDALRAISYGLLYITFIIIGSLIFTLAGYSLIQAFFTVASAQGNVGLNIVSVNYYNMLPWLKFQLILHMIIGRVEIIPFIVMLRSIWGK